MTLTGDPTRISKAHIDGLVVARFADMPVNTTLRKCLPNVQSSRTTRRVRRFEDLPVPSIAALFNAMGLTTLADIVMLDGNLEAGFVDIGLATTTKKMCGDATYGRGLTITLRLKLEKILC